jgi:hypothetical protein
MKRREFIRKSCVALGGTTLASCGFLGCGKKEEKKAEEAVPSPEPQLSRLDMLKKNLMEKRGMSEADVATMMAELQEKLPMVKENCICATCPSYVEGETKLGFCHPLVGMSDKITERKGCDCPGCPVTKMMGLKRGYYCVQGSDLEMDLAEM